MFIQATTVPMIQFAKPINSVSDSALFPRLFETTAFDGSDTVPNSAKYESLPLEDTQGNGIVKPASCPRSLHNLGSPIRESAQPTPMLTPRISMLLVLPMFNSTRVVSTSTFPWDRTKCTQT